MEETIDIKDLIRLLLSKLWLLILFTVIGGAAAFGISKTMLPLEYSSHITMYVQSYYGGGQNNNENNISNSKQLVNTYMEVLKDDAVMNAVGDMLSNQYERYTLEQNFTYLNGRINPASIRSCLNISSVTDTSAVNIKATAKNADIAASICNNLTSVAPEFVKNAVGVGSINTIDKAKVYNTPVAPNTTKNTLLGAIAGFMITALIVFVIDFFDNTVKDPDYINERFKKAIIGEIQQFDVEKKKKKNKKNSKKNSPDGSDYVKLSDKNVPFSVVESYKSIRTNISFALSTADKKIFAVSSANPGEGKSTTSANIAIAIAESGQKVLLIDADMRKSMQHKIFGLKNKKGLSTAISKMNNVEDCIQKSSVKNLDIMTAGPMPPNPSELLASKNMGELIEKLSEQYDNIIIDTAPVNVVTDAMELSNKVSGIVMVLRYAKTTNDDIENVIKKMDFAQINVLGFIINGIKIKRSGKYYSGGSYYYRKGYGYYGAKEEPETEEKDKDKEKDKK